METNSNVVAEVVQTSISVSSQHYQDVYNKYMQPILLAQPGMLLALAGVVTSGESATVISLVIWENVNAHIAFVSGDAAIPFFEASMPCMSAPPSIEHYDIEGLQLPAIHSQYARVLKASNANDKELLGRIQGRHAATEGTGMTMLSDCVEDTSQRTLILFSNFDKFEASAEVTDGNETIKSYTVAWYSRGIKSPA